MAGALLKAAALAAFNAGAPLAVANVLASAGTAFVVNAAITVGATYALQKATAPGRPGPSNAQTEVKQPVPPLRVVLGRMKLAGPLAFAATQNNSFNQPVYARIILHAGHEIDGIETHYLYGRPAELGTDDFVINFFGPIDDAFYVRIKSHLGTTTQLADDTLLSIFPDWTSEHRGRGIAYSALILNNPHNGEDVPKIYPQGPPELATLFRGKKVYDPTKDSTNGGSGSHRMNNEATWEWTEEQRLLMAWYLADPLGYGKGYDRLDWATWYPQILRGRELVDLKDGGTEARYRLALAYEPATEEKSAVFNRIASAGDARIAFTADGKIACRGGGWDAPTVALNADVAGIEAEFGRPDRMDAANVLHFKFLSPPHDYVEQPGDPWRNEAAIAASGGEEREREVDLTHIPSHGQARRVLKQMSARENPAWEGSLRTKLHGLAAIGEDAIDLSFDEFDDGSGDFDGAYWLDGEISDDLDTETVALTVKAADPTSYDWDAETEEGDAPEVPGALPGSGSVLMSDDADFGIDDDNDDNLLDEAA